MTARHGTSEGAKTRENATPKPSTDPAEAIALKHLGDAGRGRRHGNGSPKPADRTDRTSFVGREPGQNGHAPSSVSSVSGFPGGGSAPGARQSAPNWEDPLPIDAPPLPAFPVTELGEHLSPMVEAAAEQFQTPVDLAAMTALGVISAAIGGRRRIKVRPGWDETTSVWMAGLAGSSELKSPLVRKLSAPICDAEKALQIDKKDAIEELEQDRRIAESQMKAAENKAGTAKKPEERDGAVKEAKEARKRLAEIGNVPHMPRIIFGDLTPEIAAKRCAEQGGRMSIISDEGGTLEMLTGSGSSKDQPNINFFLKAYSGDSEPVDRITRDTVLSDEAHVAMALLFQPAVLDGLARKHSKLLGKGLFGRFLYALPVSRVGSRLENPEPVPENINNAYAKRIEDLVELVWDTNCCDDIKFTSGATKVLAAFRGALEPRLGPRGDLHAIGEWAGKLAGNCARVAALLALFDNPMCREVDDKYVTRAVNLGPYFIAHAKRVYELMGRKEDDETLDVARDALAWIRHRTDPLEAFTKRDMQRGLARRVTSAEQVQDAIDLLAETGWVAPQPAPERPEGQGGRPPLPRYEVHPWCSEK